MNRQQHLDAARSLLNRGIRLASSNETIAAGELLWGATVNAVSAADPDHQQQPPDRFSNPHLAPSTSRNFLAAIARVQPVPLTQIQTAACFHNGQRRLHNHFYHLNLTQFEVQICSAIAAGYAQILIAAAERSLRT